MSDLKTNLQSILNEKTTKIIPENIKKDVTIFNVTGTLEEGMDTSDATATANDIISGKTAYANGEKLVGTMPENPNNTFIDFGTSTSISSIYKYIKSISQLDTSNVTNMQNMFNDCTNLTTIPLLNTSKVTNMSAMFGSCTNLTEIPQLDTSKVTNMQNMFSGCTNLTIIPLLDTSSVTIMQYMFKGCNSLTDESLNNILAMCKNATSHSIAKTLKYISLTSDQATRCTTLSNYSEFIAAGWTTGY